VDFGQCRLRLAETGDQYPEGITSFSPALADDLPRRSGTKVGIGLRWVVNHKLKSTLKGLHQIAPPLPQPRWG